jgi:hypothetical protein
MTWEEVQRKAATPGLSADERAGLWECLYQRKEEIDELLAFVKANAAHLWIQGQRIEFASNPCRTCSRYL